MQKGYIPKCLLVSLCIISLHRSWVLLIQVSRTSHGIEQNVRSDAPQIEELEQLERAEDGTRVIHIGIFGLGHRLIRASTAWHFAKHLNVTSIKFKWGTCGRDHTDGLEIFPYLFDHDTWQLPRSIPTTTTRTASAILTSSMSANPSFAKKQILIRNDIYGYVPGQSLKDFAIPLDMHYKSIDGRIFDKLTSDVEFYKEVVKRYHFKDQINEFMIKNRFAEHTVIGIHLRAGNGEQEHFHHAGRKITNETQFTSRLVDLVVRFVEKENTEGTGLFNREEKPVMVFLATDTPSLVPVLTVSFQSKLGIATVVMPQIRVKADEGVTFKALQGKGEKCLLGWQAMVSDMIQLSMSDLVIAARYSSFTQSLPLSLLLDSTTNQDTLKFCEVSDAADTMSCYRKLDTWLYQDYQNVASYRLEEYSQNEIETKHVLHKLLIHLPDVRHPKEYDHVLEFLDRPDRELENGTTTHSYGDKRFNPRFRGRRRTPMSPFFNFTG